MNTQTFILASALLVVAVSAQCNIRPQYADSIATGDGYEYTAHGSAVEWPTSEEDLTPGLLPMPGSGDRVVWTGRVLNGTYQPTTDDGINDHTHTLLIGYSALIDGNTAAGDDGSEVDVVNYDMHTFSTETGCFVLQEDGVYVGEHDHDHDSGAFNDDYHDGTAVFYTLSDGTTVAGVPEPPTTGAGLTAYGDGFGSPAQSESTGTLTGTASFTDLPAGWPTSAPYVYNDVAFTNPDTCVDILLCEYGYQDRRLAALFKAPVGAEVVSISIIHFNVYPGDMADDDTFRDYEHIMGVSLLQERPNTMCTPPDMCDGVIETDEMCPSLDDCECSCTPDLDVCVTNEVPCGTESVEVSSQSSKCVCLEFVEEQDGTGDF